MGRGWRGPKFAFLPLPNVASLLPAASESTETKTPRGDRTSSAAEVSAVPRYAPSASGGSSGSPSLRRQPGGAARPSPADKAGAPLYIIGMCDLASALSSSAPHTHKASTRRECASASNTTWLAPEAATRPPSKGLSANAVSEAPVKGQCLRQRPDGTCSTASFIAPQHASSTSPSSPQNDNATGNPFRLSKLCTILPFSNE